MPTLFTSLTKLPINEPIADYIPTDVAAHIPTALDKDLFYTSQAIRQRSAMHPNLIAMMDDALNGAPHSNDAIMHYMPTEEHLTGPDAWDGKIGDNKLIMSEEILWCTLRDYYGWTIPSHESVQAIQGIAQDKTIIEFGQGTGFLARVLEACGSNIITAETFSGRIKGLGVWRTPDTSDGYALSYAHPDAPLLISWPDSDINPDFLAHRASGSDLILLGNPEYCGINPDILRQYGYTEHPTNQTSVCSSGHLAPIQHWRAP